MIDKEKLYEAKQVALAASSAITTNMRPDLLEQVYQQTFTPSFCLTLIEEVENLQDDVTRLHREKVDLLYPEMKGSTERDLTMEKVK